MIRWKSIPIPLKGYNWNYKLWSYHRLPTIVSIKTQILKTPPMADFIDRFSQTRGIYVDILRWIGNYIDGFCQIVNYVEIFWRTVNYIDIFRRIGKYVNGFHQIGNFIDGFHHIGSYVDRFCQIGHYVNGFCRIRNQIGNLCWQISSNRKSKSTYFVE